MTAQIKLAKVIILEGPDGGGKTTLAKRLHDEYGYHIIKTNAPAPGETVFNTYTDTLLAALKSGERTVFDRHYLGEKIYGPLLRGGNSIGDQGVSLIERLIAANDVRTIVCIPPWKTLIQGWSCKDDLLKRRQQLKAVRDAYAVEAKRLGTKLYDWTGGGMPLLASLGSLPDTMTGYRDADVLFVGDTPGTSGPDWDLPFHCLTGSSRYIYDALQQVKLWEEKRSAWINAYGRQRPMDIGAAVKTLPRLRRVIALGVNAEKACRFCGIVPTGTVPHPQYWRRFYHDDLKGYAMKLERAMV